MMLYGNGTNFFEVMIKAAKRATLEIPGKADVNDEELMTGAVRPSESMKSHTLDT